MPESNHEALREALLNIQRVREKEQAAREQMETLIEGLQILNESDSVTSMFREILGSLKRVIPFDCAAILVQSDNGYLSTAVSSDSRLQLSSFQSIGIFERCLGGKAAAVTRIDKVAEWPAMPEHNEEPLQSALLVALPGLDQPTIIVCASSGVSTLKRSDLKMLRTFSPLATQAVQRASELEQLNILINKLDYYAHYDMMTGLPNRTLFDIRLEQELSKDEQNFSVIFLDLDNFKQINDTYGHNAGDLLLGEIAFRISASINPHDTVARMGGDEFALILRGLKDIPSVYAVCERLISKVSEPLYLRKSRVDPTVSIGIALCTDQNQTAQYLMQNADIALYETKKNGRNGYQLFNLKMKTELDRKTTIETKLKNALQNNELWLAYQMIVDANTHDCTCLEVLLRWSPDETSSYCPTEFIPIAEATGEICNIGLWVIERALVELADWLSQDSQNMVAINVSDVQLHRAAFADEVMFVVSQSGIAAQQIELELSERIIAANINEVVIDNLNKLQKFGLLFSYDDFGTGQASFLHLQQLPGSRLKIDKGFIDTIVHSVDSRTLIKGIISFAHTLNLNVVAEGVETIEQANILTSIECDYLQGYCFSRPVPLIECMRSMNSHMNNSLVHQQ